nr:hypothetical protein [Tanacetum cinerariifolium]
MAFTVLTIFQAVEATDDSLAIPEHTIVETPMNMSRENKAHFLAEKEAIHLILTGIGDEIYSTVDACQIVQEMWEAIKRLQQGESLNIQDVKTDFFRNLPEWSRFMMIVKQQHKLDEVSHHKLFDILKQYQNEFNELRAERLARNANPLALVATAQANQDPYFQTSRSHKSHAPSSKPSIPTRSHIATRHKGKEIAKPITPPSETASEEDSDLEQAQRDKDIFEEDSSRKDSGETDDSNVIPDLPDMCEDGIQNDQNDVESDDERVALANLIANLKLDVDENKKIQKQLKKANTTLAQELKECKAILTETSKSMGESISVRDSCLVALQTKQTEFEKYKAFNDCTIDYDKLEHQFRAPTSQDMKILIQTCLMPLAIKTQNDSFRFVHELKQEMHADLKYVESLEKEIDELKSNKAEFSDVYDVILQECVSKDVMCSYLMSLSDLDVLDELQCLYLHKVKECGCLAQKLSKQTEYVSKKVHTKLLQRFAKVEKHSISLEISLQKCKEQKLIEKGKGKSVDTKFDRPSVVRQPNAQRIPKPSVLGKPIPFSDSLDRIYFQKTKSVPKTNVSEGLSKPVTSQTLPQTARQAVSNTNVLKPGMYRIDNRSTQTRAPQLPQTVRNTNPRVSTSTGVNHNTNVSIPQLKSNQSRDKVLPNNSQVKAKKSQVEVHPRIPSVSNKMKSVTMCKDKLNSKTLIANAVCATCNKCLVDSNHFACVTKMLNDVHARTKKPPVVHISARKPKSQTNKSIATPNKKKVASKSTNQKPQSYFRVLYEKTSKAWKWWVERKSPSRYKWVPKMKKKWVPKPKMQWVPKAKNDHVQKRIIQLILFIFDSGCMKHMMGNLKLLCNFVEKFMGFITSKASITISSQLVNFVMRIWRSDLYTISLQESTSSTLVCLMAKATPTQAWLWYRRLSHLNFDYFNLLSKKDIVIGLPKLKKFERKAKFASHGLMWSNAGC